MKYYTGVGSRQTPPPVLKYMTELALWLCQIGYTLRSGGAAGADSAFEAGAGTLKEIYLPWVGFNGRGPKDGLYMDLFAASFIAAQHHPAWDKLTNGGRKLHSRNAHQVLGQDLKSPSEFVVCWTPGGSGSGGTGTAIRIAKAYNVPVYDIGRKEDGEALYNYLTTLRR